jgi:hypothetical protein
MPKPHFSQPRRKHFMAGFDAFTQEVCPEKPVGPRDEYLHDLNKKQCIFNRTKYENCVFLTLRTEANSYP